MKRGSIVAAFAAGLALGVVLPLAGQVTVPALTLELYGVPRGHEVYLACTESNGALISGGTPSFNAAGMSYGGLAFYPVRVRCN